jgi:hypothetical protein
MIEGLIKIQKNMKWIKERMHYLRMIFILTGLALIGSCSSKNEPLIALLSPIEQNLVEPGSFNR